jgi:hypothetical protein
MLQTTNMRIVALFICFIILTVPLAAQKKFKQNSAYVELLGNGLILSASYERQVKQKPGLGWHIGIGLGGDLPAIPFGLRYLFVLDKNQKSLLETGFGATLLEKEMWKGAIGNGERDPYQPGFIPSVSYRRHASSGFMYRLSIMSVIHKTGSVPFFFGGSMGWRF